ncbi:uncharacterized protein V1516DRAFT_670367 [Lipomyces oligophaga]|uniref:uncharacterized protein n=1 Tax=Lipomyces oligophaga TaxID=45792 RepID=UPI0034CFA51D
MSFARSLTRTLSAARDGDWLPISSQGNWSARFRDASDNSDQLSLPLYSPKISSEDNTAPIADPLGQVSQSSLHPSLSGNSSTGTVRLTRSGASLSRLSEMSAADSQEFSTHNDPDDSAEKYKHKVYSSGTTTAAAAAAVAALNLNDILIPRRKLSTSHKLTAGLVGVWLLIAFIILFTNRTAADFDPLRTTIHNSKTLVDPTDKRAMYIGRWSRNKAPGSASGQLVSSYFPGAYVDVRFSGTSLGIHLGNFEVPVTMSVLVDHSREFTVVPYGREVISLASGLSDGQHEVRVMFGGGSTQLAPRTDIEAFYVDKGKSLLAFPISRTVRKTIEVFTDHYNTSQYDMLSWPYLVADSLGVDTSLIAADGSCISNCPGDIVGLDKMFFLGYLSAARSMPKYWRFDKIHPPSVLVLELGSATKKLVEQQGLYRTLLPQDAFKTYVEAYVNMIRQIRKKAYKPTPIVVLRPFDGSYEVESLSVVQTLRQQGDMNTYWIDTTTWVTESDDEETKQAKRAAILSEHLCPFVKHEADCSFLRPFDVKINRPNDDA